MFFDKFWGAEVDRLYIGFNSPIEETVLNYIKELCSSRPKIILDIQIQQMDHGPTIDRLLDLCNEDYIMLIEDDGFIFKRGIVDLAFSKLESGEFDIVAGKRGSCSFEILKKAQEVYGLDYEGEGDQGPNFWPNFFFCKRQDLLNTDRDFASYSFQKDTFYPELGGVITKDGEYGDTFVWACIQLRYMGVRFGQVPQKHASPYEFDDKLNSKGNWVSPIEWIHGGSLSTGWGGYLSGAKPDFTNDYGKQEIETRVAFWIICMENTAGFENFKQDYHDGIENLIHDSRLDWGRIQLKIDIYGELMKI